MNNIFSDKSHFSLERRVSRIVTMLIAIKNTGHDMVHQPVKHDNDRF